MDVSRFGAVRRFVAHLITERDAIKAALREDKNSPDDESKIHDWFLDERRFFLHATDAVIDDYFRGPGLKKFEAVRNAALVEALRLPNSALTDCVNRAVKARNNLLSDANEAYQDNKGPEALRTYDGHCDAINELIALVNASEAANSDGTGTAGDSWITSHGGGHYSIGTSGPILFTEREDKLMQAFIGFTTLPTDVIIEASDVTKPRDVLDQIGRRNGGIFAAAIEYPGKKGSGYTVRVRRVVSG